MRLIDADALHVDYIFPTTTTGTTCYRYVSMQQINSAPTIDAVQERKGRWIHDGYDFPGGVDWIHCSECGKRGINVPADLTNYCPNCGADMRGEQNG